MGRTQVAPQHRSWARWCGLVCLVGVWAAALPVWAQAAPVVAVPSAKAEALRLYKIGRLQYKGEEFVRAAETFSRAYELDQDAILAYNAARAWERAGDLSRAVVFYRALLDLSGGGDMRVRAEKGLSRIEGIQEAQRAREAEASRPVGVLDIRTDTAAEVLVDGRLLGTAPGRFELSPGRHAVALRRMGARRDRRVVEIVAGETTRVFAVLEALETAGDPVGWSGFGLMGGGVILGAMALGARDAGRPDELSVGLGVSASVLEVAGVGLLVWSLVASSVETSGVETIAP